MKFHTKMLLAYLVIIVFACIQAGGCAVRGWWWLVAVYVAVVLVATSQLVGWHLRAAE